VRVPRLRLRTCLILAALASLGMFAEVARRRWEYHTEMQRRHERAGALLRQEVEAIQQDVARGRVSKVASEGRADALRDVAAAESREAESHARRRREILPLLPGNAGTSPPSPRP
jgi:hypothetical protein